MEVVSCAMFLLIINATIQRTRRRGLQRNYLWKGCDAVVFGYSALLDTYSPFRCCAEKQLFGENLANQPSGVE